MDEFKFPVVHVSKDYREKENERIGKLTGDITFVLKDRNVNCCSVFLVKSPKYKNIVESGKKCCIMKELSLEVEEVTIIDILLCRPVRLNPANLGDYFMFFKMLGLRDEVYRLVDSLSIFKTFRENFFLFVKFIEKFCVTSNRKWYDYEFLNSVDLHSFALKLLNQLQDYREQVKLGDEIIDEEPGVNKLIRKLSFYTKADVKDHNDYQLLGITESINSFLAFLWDSKIGSNMIARSMDGKEYQVHEEVLFWRSEHFSISSNLGIDRRIMKSKKEFTFKVQSNHLELYLEYLYTFNIASEEIGVLLNLFCFSDYVLDDEFKLKVFTKLSSIFESQTIEGKDSKKIVLEYGFVFRDSPLKKYFKSLFRCIGMKKRKIDEYIERSVKEKIPLFSLHTIQMVVNTQGKYIRELEKQNEETILESDSKEEEGEYQNQYNDDEEEYKNKLIKLIKLKEYFPALDELEKLSDKYNDLEKVRVCYHRIQYLDSVRKKHKEKLEAVKKEKSLKNRLKNSEEIIANMKYDLREFISETTKKNEDTISLLSKFSQNIEEKKTEIASLKSKSVRETKRRKDMKTEIASLRSKSMREAKLRKDMKTEIASLQMLRWNVELKLVDV